MAIPEMPIKLVNTIKCHQMIEHTRLASSLNGRHSPNALTKVVIFFLGSGLARARIIGFRGLVKKRTICIIPSLD